LRARPETSAARVGDGAGRPLLGGDPATALIHLNSVRAPLYAEVADVVLDVDELSAAAVVDRIIDAMDASAAATATTPEAGTAPTAATNPGKAR
jgi:shikimate kinase